MIADVYIRRVHLERRCGFPPFLFLFTELQFKLILDIIIRRNNVPTTLHQFFSTFHFIYKYIYVKNKDKDWIIAWCQDLIDLKVKSSRMLRNVIYSARQLATVTDISCCMQLCTLSVQALMHIKGFSQGLKTLKLLISRCKYKILAKPSVCRVFAYELS